MVIDQQGPNISVQEKNKKNPQPFIRKNQIHTLSSQREENHHKKNRNLLRNVKLSYFQGLFIIVPFKSYLPIYEVKAKH